MFLLFMLAAIFGSQVSVDLSEYGYSWDSPDTDFDRRTIVSFEEHGTLFSDGSSLYVACNLGFVEIEGEERWRAAVVYDDRVVLFQEGTDPVTTYYDFPVGRCSFSESCEFVVIHDCADADNDRNALKINTLSGEQAYLDSERDGLFGWGSIMVWNNGALMVHRRLANEGFFFRTYFFSPQLEVVNTWDSFNAGKVSFSDPYMIVPCSDGLLCFNSAGEEIWREPISVFPVVPPMVMNDEFIVMPTYTGVQMHSLETGELLWVKPLDLSYPISARAAAAPNSNQWLCIYGAGHDLLIKGNEILESVEVIRASRALPFPNPRLMLTGGNLALFSSSSDSGLFFILLDNSSLELKATLKQDPFYRDSYSIQEWATTFLFSPERNMLLYATNSTIESMEGVY